MKRFCILFWLCLFFSLTAESSDTQTDANQAAEIESSGSKECAEVSIKTDPAVTGEKNSGADANLNEIEKLLSSFLASEDVDTLLQEHQLFRSIYNEKNMQPALVPPFEVPRLFAAQWKKDTPACLIESLYLYKKKLDKKKDVRTISRIFRSISQLKGLEYYSSSRKKMRTLYESSYVIDDPETKIKQDDPVERAETDFSVYALQKDLTFGEHVYRYRFISDDNSSGFISTNNDLLKYKVFKAVKPNDLQVSICVTDLGDYLLIHGLTRADFTSLSVLRKRVQRSFKTRGEAVLKWFIEKYEEKSE